MTTDVQTRSAKIYQFPVGGRSGLSRSKPDRRFSRERTTHFAEDIVVGSSWYHEEAIQEAERARKSRQ